MRWFSVLEIVVLFALFFWLPAMRSADFFAVQVSREFFLNEGRKYVRQYRWALLLAGVFAAALSITIVPQKVSVWGAVPPVLFMVLSIGLIRYFHREVQPYKIASSPMKIVASLHARRLSEYTSLSLEMTILLLTVLPIIINLHWYPVLPVQIPVHWNFAGQADRWAQKSPMIVALLPLTAIWMQGLLLWSKYSIVKTRMTLPARNTEAYLALKEKSLQLMTRFFDVLRILLACLLGHLSLGVFVSTLATGQQLVVGWSIGIWVITALMILATLIFIAKTLSINNQLEDLTGGQIPGAAFEESGWVGGGLFYYNPRDPALFVEKKIGLGNTINFAHKQALYFTAYLLGGGSVLFLLAITNF